MTKNTLNQYLLNQYLNDTRGAFAVNFAIIITVILIAVGVAVDIGSMSSEKTKLQDLSDSVALAAALSGLETEAELQEYAINYAKAPHFEGAQPQLALKNGSIVVNMSKPHNLFLMSAFDKDIDEINAVTEVTIPGSSLRNTNLALVLDTTLSMQGSKLDALKDAANEMLTGLDEGNSSNTMISLVPFADYIRIPVSNKDQNWLNAPADATRTVNVLDRGASTNCRNVATTSENTDIVCDAYVYTQRVDNNSWEGCMGSRRMGLHVTPDFDGSRLPGFWQNGNCRESWNNELLPLTKDIGAVKTALDNLFARGSTYTPAGLIWGWRTLSPNAPFEEVRENPNASNIIVLMTDGTNSVSLNGETNHMEGIFHYGEDTEADSKAAADALTRTLCTSIKNADIEIYTITYEVADTSTKSLFQECATSSNHYFDANNSDSLKTAFLSIGSGISEIRISR